MIAKAGVLMWMIAVAFAVGYAVSSIPLFDPVAQAGAWWKWALLAALVAGVFVAVEDIVSVGVAAGFCALMSIVIAAQIWSGQLFPAILIASAIAIYVLSRLARAAWFWCLTASLVDAE